MKVLYIGYPKTGTKTIHAALEILGYNVYDFEEHFYYHGNEWSKILKSGGTKEYFKKMYENVDAILDTPTFLYWQEILEAFPDCKLIVSYRDEKSWKNSWINQVEKVIGNKKLKVLGMLSPTCQSQMRFGRLCNRVVFGGEDSILPWKSFHGMNYQLSLKKYRQHNLEIKMNAPQNQLLVINYSEGWENLCKFLDKPIPKVPFPHENKSGVILEERISNHPLYVKIKREAIFTIMLLTLSGASVVYNKQIRKVYHQFRKWFWVKYCGVFKGIFNGNL